MKAYIVGLCLMMTANLSYGSKDFPLSVGDRQALRVGEAIPKIQAGTLWHVTGHIQNMSMFVTGPILELKLVAQDPQVIPEKMNSTEIGGYLPGSSSSAELRLMEAESGKLVIEAYRKFFAVVGDYLYADKTTRIVSDPKELPVLPPGYTWAEEHRMSGIRSLIPGLGGSFRSSHDKISYILKRRELSLPEQVQISRVVVGAAKNEEEFRKSLNCEVILANPLLLAKKITD